METIIFTLFESIFIFPGAFLRWGFQYQFKRPFKDIIKDDGYLNSSIGALGLMVIGGGIYYLFFT